MITLFTCLKIHLMLYFGVDHMKSVLVNESTEKKRRSWYSPITLIIFQQDLMYDKKYVLLVVIKRFRINIICIKQIQFML